MSFRLAVSVLGHLAIAESRDVSKHTAPWTCHHYVGKQLETKWCETAGIEGGYEYDYFEGGAKSPCSPCWCCKRAADQNHSKNSTGSTRKSQAKYEKHDIVVGGVSSAVLAGDGRGSVQGDALTMNHDSGFTLFSGFADRWEPSKIIQLKLLGKMISFTVDLSKVGCACNVAFYLISSPAHGPDGALSPGNGQDRQPPYYCDANDVGGQWCPEVDIMEANTHAFQATPHKCNAPINGHYDNCDRGSCGRSSRDEPDAYGPGASYVIDTRHPFEVRTEFVEDHGALTNMQTSLVQGDQHVTLHHAGCDAKYLSKLQGALADGMSLRITYWGDKAETMAWMDQPPCGAETCSGTNAGQAIIRNISVGPRPPARQEKTDLGDHLLTWVVSGQEDDLFGSVIPQDVINDPKLFLSRGGHAIAKWRAGWHFAQPQQQVAQTDKEIVVVRRYEDADLPPPASAAEVGSTHWGISAALLVLSLASFAALVAFSVRRMHCPSFQKGPSTKKVGDPDCQAVMLDSLIDDDSSTDGGFESDTIDDAL